MLTTFIGLGVQAANNLSTYKTDVVVDGLNAEWKMPLSRVNKIAGITYDIANDERNIYLIIRVTDTTSLRQVRQNGMEVWINKDGKKINTTGITYPMAPDKPKNNKLVPILNADGFTWNINELKLTGFLLENGRQPVKGCEVKVAIKKDSSDCLVYEAAIPFNTFYKETLEKGDLKDKFYIGVVIKGMTETNDDAMRSIVMNRMARSGGFHGEGPGMGGMGGMNRMMSVMGDLVDKICWQKIQFTLK